MRADRQYTDAKAQFNHAHDRRNVPAFLHATARHTVCRECALDARATTRVSVQRNEGGIGKRAPHQRRTARKRVRIGQHRA